MKLLKLNCDILLLLNIVPRRGQIFAAGDAEAYNFLKKSCKQFIFLLQ